MPITGAIGFSASGIYFQQNEIKIGIVPSGDEWGGGQFGTSTVMSGGTGGPYQAPNSQLTIAPDGSISMNILGNGASMVPGQVGGMGGPMTLTATGIVELSSVKMQNVMMAFGGYSMGSYMTGSTTGMMGANQPCVTAVAISMSVSGTNLYGGHVYLYLQNPGTMGSQYPGVITSMGSGHGTIMTF